MILSPIGFAACTFLLWIRRNVTLFIASAVLVGLVTGLWPFLLALG